MKKILVFGAGLSSTYLIHYLLEQADNEQWEITVADAALAQAAKKVGEHPKAQAIQLDASDTDAVKIAVEAHDLVISLMPPTIHPLIAKICVMYGKHLITASYVSDEMKLLHDDAVEAGVLLLNECGLDPGIDHLSAMKIIHEIEENGGTVTSFKSYCGGLVAPEFDDNPWNYKFTWNPKNVVLAGQATAKYLHQHELTFIPPSRIFTETETIDMGEFGMYESYANRDSLGYIKPYGLTKAHTVLRGTLRKPGYGAAWNALYLLGLTDDTFVINNTNELTYASWVSAFTPGNKQLPLEQRVADFLGIRVDDIIMQKLSWLGLFSDEKITLNNGTPAAILLHLLQQKWQLKQGELDMIVMHHIIGYELNGEQKEVKSSLMVKGETAELTAMAKTVGLPMAITAKNILQQKITDSGVQIPLTPMYYNPVLKELATYGVIFTEQW